MHDLTGFQRDLLYALAGLKEPSGLAVKAVLDEYYGREINYGRLYLNLDTLVEKGLVEKGKHDDRTNAELLDDIVGPASSPATSSRRPSPIS